MRSFNKKKLSLIKVSVLCWMFFSTFHYAQAFTISGSGEINGDFESISAQLIIKKISETEIVSKSVQIEQIADGYIDIILPGDDNKAIYRGSAEPKIKTNFSDNFYWELISGQVENDSESQEKFQITVNLAIYQIAGSGGKSLEELKATSAGRESITVRGRFNPWNGKGNVMDASGSTADFEASKLLARPNEAPSNFSTAAVFRGIAASWTASNQVVYTDEKSRAPSQVLVFTFSAQSGSVNLKAKLFNPQTGQDTDTTCVFIGGSDCIKCPNSGAYLSASQDLSADGLISVASTSNTGYARISNLDPEKSFVSVLQYKDGLKRTSCKTTTPSENITLTELHGDKSAQEDPRCFIATAAYGSPLEKEVNTFRWFRSAILLQFAFGKKLVGLYYEKSPKMAQWIAASETRRILARAALWLPQKMISAMQFVYFNSIFSLLFLGLFLLFTIKAARKKRTL